MFFKPKIKGDILDRLAYGNDLHLEAMTVIATQRLRIFQLEVLLKDAGITVTKEQRQ